VMLVHPPGGSTSYIQLYEGVEYCLRVYKGSTAAFGSSSGSNKISVLAGSSTALASISVTEAPKQYVQCFKTPGDACPSPGGQYGEYIAIGLAAGIDSFKVKSLSEEAWSASDESKLPGKFDGEQDAFRHCYFSCRATQEMGASKAEAVGDIHENCFFHGWAERAKDQFNNKKGREFGQTGGTDCNERCYDAAEDAELKIYV